MMMLKVCTGIKKMMHPFAIHFADIHIVAGPYAFFLCGP
jgi:hypothetical protein